jgi:hypothetical protein
VEQESANELSGLQAHHPHLIAVAIVPPEKADLAVVYGRQPVIRDRHPMSVAPEIVKYAGRTSEGPPGIDLPVDSASALQQAIKRLAPLQMFYRPVEVDLTPVEGPVEE